MIGPLIEAISAAPLFSPFCAKRLTSAVTRVAVRVDRQSRAAPESVERKATLKVQSRISLSATGAG